MNDELLAETSVLGSIFIDPNAVPIVLEKLTEFDFQSDTGKAVFRAVQAMYKDGATIDPVTIQKKVAEKGANIPSTYLLHAMEVTLTAANVEAYCEVLSADAKRRHLITVTEEASTALINREDPLAVSSKLMSDIEKINNKEEASSMVSSTEAMLEFLDYRDRVESGEEPYVRTGYNKLDETLGGGLVNEGFYILAARPGVGKTTLALQIAEKVALRGGSVLFVSLEMSLQQLSSKRLAVDTGIPSNRILLGNIDEKDYELIAEASSRLSKNPLTFNRKPGATMEDIAFMARQVKNCKLLVIDYLGLIQNKSGKSIYEKVTMTSNALKQLARSLGIPILCLAQLSRSNEQRTKKMQEPQLTDLRDSGAIEQDADGVLLLNSFKDEDAGQNDPVSLVCNLAKNRHGATGRTKMNMYPVNGRIRPLYPKERASDFKAVK